MINVYGDLLLSGNKEDTVQRKQNIRSSPVYHEMKKRVKARDKVCQVCGEIDLNGHLEVHHILPLSDYPDLACDEGNCICLCQKHHHEYHNSYDVVNAVTFTEFMKEKRGGK